MKQLCRKHGFSEASDYLWRSKFGGTSVSDAKRLKERTAPAAEEDPAGGVPDKNDWELDPSVG